LPFVQFHAETENVDDLILRMELEMPAESAVHLLLENKIKTIFLKTGRVEFHWQELLKIKILHEGFLNLQLDCGAC